MHAPNKLGQTVNYCVFWGPVESLLKNLCEKEVSKRWEEKNHSLHHLLHLPRRRFRSHRSGVCIFRLSGEPETCMGPLLLSSSFSPPFAAIPFLTPEAIAGGRGRTLARDSPDTYRSLNSKLSAWEWNKIYCFEKSRFFMFRFGESPFRCCVPWSNFSLLFSSSPSPVLRCRHQTLLLLLLPWVVASTCLLFCLLVAP